MLRISGSRQNEVRKDLPRLATMNVLYVLCQIESRGVVDMFERRRLYIRCLHEVRYRDQGTRVYGGKEKYKFWWSGSEEGRNGVEIMVKEDLVEEVIELKRLDARMMKIAVVCGS